MKKTDEREKITIRPFQIRFEDNVSNNMMKISFFTKFKI